jgi:hypothetical protein
MIGVLASISSSPLHFFAEYADDSTTGTVLISSTQLAGGRRGPSYFWKQQLQIARHLRRLGVNTYPCTLGGVLTDIVLPSQCQQGHEWYAATSRRRLLMVIVRLVARKKFDPSYKETGAYRIPRPMREQPLPSGEHIIAC